MKLQILAVACGSALVGACATLAIVNTSAAQREEITDLKTLIENVASTRSDLDRSSSQLANERQYLLELLHLEQTNCTAEIESLYCRTWVAATRSKLGSAFVILESLPQEVDRSALLNGADDLTQEVDQIVRRYVDNLKNPANVQNRIEILQSAATTLTNSVRLCCGTMRAPSNGEERQVRIQAVGLALNAFDAALEVVSLQERSESETRRSKSISRLEDALKTRTENVSLSAGRG